VTHPPPPHTCLFLFSLQAAIVNLSSYKSDLFSINLGVHNLLAGRQVLMAAAPMTNTKHVGKPGTVVVAANTAVVAKTHDNKGTGGRCQEEFEKFVKVTDDGVEIGAEPFFDGAFKQLKSSVVELYAAWDKTFERYSETKQNLLYRVSHKSLNGFARPYLRNPWDYRNGIGAKRCASSLSFVWRFKHIDYLFFPMSYGRYTLRL
jgi:hypothetical protein